MLHVEPDCAVSLVVPFGDDEDSVGSSFSALAEHLRARSVRFEILAIDEGAVDNSAMVLSLLVRSFSELRVLDSDPGQAYATGARVARGRSLVLLDLEKIRTDGMPKALAQLDRALQALISRGDDLVVFPDGLIVARRTRAWRAIVEASRRKARRDHYSFSRVLLRQARKQRLSIVEPVQ